MRDLRDIVADREVLMEAEKRRRIRFALRIPMKLQGELG